MTKKYLKKIPYSVPEPEYSRRKAEEQILPNVIKTERGCRSRAQHGATL